MEMLQMSGYISLDTVVEMLLCAQRKGERITCTYDGITLSSETVTMESAYMDVYGLTRAEVKEIENRRTDKEKKAREKIASKIIEGKAIIYPERHAAWEDLVIYDATHLYYGTLGDCSLEIMKKLEEGVELTCEEVDKILFKTNGSVALLIICDMHKKGPEFVEKYYTEMGRRIDPELKEHIEKKKAENAELEKKYSGDYSGTIKI